MSWIVYGAVAYLAYRWVTAEQKSPSKAKKQKRAPKPAAPPDPYTLLDVPPTAPMEEVRHAYQEKVAAYHPDRVANAAPELRELAEARTKELNAAYDAIRRQRER